MRLSLFSQARARVYALAENIQKDKEIADILNELGLFENWADVLADNRKLAVALIGPSQLGKTTLIEHVIVFFLPHRLRYTLKPWNSLEAMRKFRELQRKGQGSAPVECQVLQRPAWFKEGMAETEKATLEERIMRAREQIKWAKEYKLDNSDHNALGLLFPTAGQGAIGSNAPVATSGSESEFQVLLVFESREAILGQLHQHMDVVAGCLDLDLDKATKDYLRDCVWRLFTLPGSDVHSEIEKRSADPDGYNPPLNDRFMRLADRAVAWRSRARSHECTEDPDLLAIELLSAGDFLRICLPPGADADWAFTEEQVALLEDLSQQDTEAIGPWRMLLDAARSGSKEELRQCREALLVLTQHLHLFAPNKLLSTLDIELIDSVGFGDPNSRRQVVQRQLEARVDHMIVMLDMSMMQPAREYLQNSPFVARLIDAHLHPDPSTPPPTLSFMVYREQLGYEPPPRSGYRGKAVTLRYMVQFGGENFLEPALRSKAVGPTRKALMELFNGYKAERAEDCQEGQLALPNEDLPKVLMELARTIPIGYMFPLLGMSIFCELEVASAAQAATCSGSSNYVARGDWTDALASVRQHRQEQKQNEQQELQTPQGQQQGKGGATGSETRQQLMDEDSEQDDENGEQPPGERVTTLSVPILQKALRDTRLDEFLASLLQGQYNRVTTLISRMLEACSAALGSIEDQLSSDETLPKIRERFRLHDYKYVRHEGKMRDLEEKVGSGSLLECQVHNRFGNLNTDVLQPQVKKVVQDQIRSDIQAAAEVTVNKIIKKFKLLDIRQQRVTALEHALDPASGWDASDAPILMWLETAFSNHVKFSGLKTLLQSLRDRVKQISKEVVVEAVMQTASDSMSAEEREDWRDKWGQVFTQMLKLEAVVDRNFQTVFFKGRKSEPVAEYRRVLVEELRSRLPQLSATLQTHVRRAQRRCNAQGLNKGQLLAETLRCWFTRSLPETLVSNGNGGEGLCRRLQENLSDKLQDVRHRLYDNGLPARAEQEARRHLRWGTLFLKCVKQAIHLLEQRFQELNIARLQLARDRIRGLQDQLQAAAQPAQLAACLDPTMRRLLEPALVKAKARTAFSGPSPRSLFPGMQQEPAVDGTSTASAATHAVTTAATGARWQDCDWGNTAAGRGVAVTAAQMAAFEEELARNGHARRSCPGRYNDCFYYALLSQVQGISCEASDRDALLAVESFRDLVRNVLEELLAVEEALPEEEQEWTSAILALQGRPADHAGATTDMEARRALLRRHLEGVWPAFGRGARSQGGNDEAGVRPMTYVELAVAARLLKDSNCGLYVYNPTYQAALGYLNVILEAPQESAVVVRIVNVPAGGAGELNHWEALVPAVLAGGDSAPATGKASASKSLLQNASSGLLDGEGTSDQTAKRQRTGDA